MIQKGFGKETTSKEPERVSIPVDNDVIQNFIKLRLLVCSINNDIEDTDGLSIIPTVSLETDGYEYYIKFLGQLIWDTDNYGWDGKGIVEIHKLVRDKIRTTLESYGKITV